VSKAAVTKLVENTAAELAPDALRVVGLAPGWVALGDGGDTLADLTNPVTGRSIEPAHLADLVLSLAAPTSGLSGVRCGWTTPAR
jgi:NAD(P)-dependent dehydrogenase (short-subunit alcohol dehydrogenase family)